jgi:hypothetical protein
MPSVSNPFLTSKNDSAAASQPHPSDRDDQVEKHAAWHRHVADTCRRESDRFGAAFTAGTAALCLAGNYFLHGYCQHHETT